MKAEFHENGMIKMEFDRSTPDHIKKAALKWAKKRGLKATEASLNKSANHPESYVFSVSGKNLPLTDSFISKEWKFK